MIYLPLTQAGSPPTSQHPKGTIKAFLDNRSTPRSANHAGKIVGALRNLKLIFWAIQRGSASADILIFSILFKFQLIHSLTLRIRKG